MPSLTRRQFVKGTLAAGAALWPAGRVLGANEDLRVGVIGVGGRGNGLAGSFHGIPGVRIAGVCDADAGHAERAKQRFEGAKAWTDMRALIDDKSIDAVVVATCNHWHVLASLWACQAGKDVYVEKPISHNI